MTLHHAVPQPSKGVCDDCLRQSDETYEIERRDVLGKRETVTLCGDCVPTCGHLHQTGLTLFKCDFLRHKDSAFCFAHQHEVLRGEIADAMRDGDLEALEMHTADLVSLLGEAVPA